jgi:hypothetical protein
MRTWGANTLVVETVSRPCTNVVRMRWHMHEGYATCNSSGNAEG